MKDYTKRGQGSRMWRHRPKDDQSIPLYAIVIRIFMYLIICRFVDSL